MRKHSGFTLAELIVVVILLSIFFVIASGGFIGIIDKAVSMKSIALEQEMLLYDNFVLDSVFRNVSKIIPVQVGGTSGTSTGYLYILDRTVNTIPFGYVAFPVSSGSVRPSGTISPVPLYTLGVKKFIPYNDILRFGTDMIYSAPWDNDIRYVATNASLTSQLRDILNNPTGLYTTGGTLYIADTGNICIRKDTSIDSCYAGTLGEIGLDTTHFASPMGIAGTGSDIYIADTYNHVIRHFTTASPTLDTVFGDGTAGIRIGPGVTGTSIRFNLPTGIAILDNELFVADSGNNRIVRLNLVSKTGAVYIGNGSASSVFVGSVTGGSTYGVTNVSLNFPTSVKISGTNLYVSEGLSGLVKQVNLTTNTITDVVGSLGNLAYFGSFEQPQIGNSYGIIGGAGSLALSGEVVPFEGNQSLRIAGDGTNNNTGALQYEFAAGGVTFAQDQSLAVSFRAKSSTGSYTISYGPTLSDTFLVTATLTGTIGSTGWTLFAQTIRPTTAANGYRVNIQALGSTGVVYLDALSIIPQNLVIDTNTGAKFENRIRYIGGIAVTSTGGLTLSNPIDGRNYDTQVTPNSTLTRYNYHFSVYSSNMHFRGYDDYRSDTEYLAPDIVPITDPILSWVVGVRFNLESRNDVHYQKYLSVQ